MPLRGEKPETIEKRFKAFFYGEAGVGKTTAAIQFPAPYLIDCERGAEQDQYTRMLSEKGGVIFQTSDFKEVVTEVKALATESHPYKTLIIDPVTIVYNNLVHEYDRKIPDSNKNKNFAMYRQANWDFDYLINMLLFKLDMNVIITAHAKNKFDMGGGDSGITFDGYKNLPYMFELALELRLTAGKRIAYVEKTRLENFEKGTMFEFSYDEVAKRYGREKLEKDATPFKAATKEQLEKFDSLCMAFKIPSNILELRLEKEGARKINELETSIIQKWIDTLESKMKVVCPDVITIEEVTPSIHTEMDNARNDNC